MIFKLGTGPQAFKLHLVHILFISFDSVLTFSPFDILYILNLYLPFDVLFFLDTVNGFSFHPSLPLAASSSGNRRFDLLDNVEEKLSLSGIRYTA